jgi:alginate O-acetyltransferase complex protein AlgI
MLFNSLSFAIFLPIVFAIYWLLKKDLKIQNILLLVASYFFYACWSYKFLFLLIFSTFLDYFTGIKMFDALTPRAKKNWFLLSVIINVGFLAIFKYYNFFISSFAEGLSSLGIHTNPWTLNVILPVGISFYTFHGLSYVIDIYKNKIKPVRNFTEYAVFVSFFPLLVAGPIERATHLLPQIQKERTFDYAQAIAGLRQILWGLFKKIVIADSCAEFSSAIFGALPVGSPPLTGSTIVIGTVFFTFQIYCDFSGYSDIAQGTARLFGIELLRNFAFPFFSRDVAEYWRRWHISLSSWFRDYLYIPLGGSKGGTWMKLRNSFIIFLVSGFWHGANWTYIFWGLLNAIYVMPSIIFNTNRTHLEIVAKGKALPSFKEALQILFTFALTVFAFVFFRADNLRQAFGYVGAIFSRSLFSVPFYNSRFSSILVLMMVGLFMFIEWRGREREFAIAKPFSNIYLRWTSYYLIVLAIIVSSGKPQAFIYFQF